VRTRRDWLQATVGALLIGVPARVLGADPFQAQANTAIEIWKSPTCGCCRRSLPATSPPSSTSTA